MVPRNYPVAGRPERSSDCNREIRMPFPPAQYFTPGYLHWNQYHTNETPGATRDTF